jgi:glutathione S-transferase
VQVHKAIGPLFSPALTGEARAAQVETVFKKLAVLEERASKQNFLAVPDAATVADYLLFPMLGWIGGYLKVRGRGGRRLGVRLLKHRCARSLPRYRHRHPFRLGPSCVAAPPLVQIEGWEAKLPHLAAWKARVAALPEVQKVLAAEGALAAGH